MIGRPELEYRTECIETFEPDGTPVSSKVEISMGLNVTNHLSGYHHADEVPGLIVRRSADVLTLTKFSIQNVRVE